MYPYRFSPSAFPLSGAALLLAAALVVTPAWAEKPDGTGGGKNKSEASDKGKPAKQQAQGPQKEKGDKGNKQAQAKSGSGERGDAVQIGVYFGSSQREVLRSYYAPQLRAGNCPPGLAKKNNGCMPPGQAKKWSMGRPLPSDVVYYPLPNEVVIRLGVPPVGHKYVRVAADILLIAIGTGMVIDAIEDLSRL